MRFLRFLLLVPLLFPLPVCGQQMQFENISSSMDLPSQETYILKQDAKGYIWFSTEQGLCRYNGEKILVYNEKNGLPEKAVYAIEKDPRGKLWFVTSVNRILYIEDEKLKEAPFSKKFQALSKSKLVMSLKFVSDHELYIGLVNEHTFRADLRTNSCEEILRLEKDYDYSVNLVGKKLVSYNGDAPNNKFPTQGLPVRLNYFVDGKLKKVIRIPDKEIPTRSSFLLTCSGNDHHYAAFRNILVVLKPDGTEEIHFFPNRILSVYLDRQGGLWIGTFLKGVFYYDKADLNARPVNSLKDFSVAHVIQDTENNIWCTTLEKGLFFCKDKRVLTYRLGNMQQNPERMTYLDSTIYVCWQKNIFAITGDTVLQFPFEVRKTDYIRDLVSWNNRYYICSQSFFVETNKKFKQAKNIRVKRWPHVTTARQLKVVDGKLYFLSSTTTGEVINGRWIPYPSKFPIPLGRCFEPVGNNRFLYGVNEGMMMITWEGDSSTAKTIPGISQPVSDIFTANNGQVLVTTKGEGLFLYTGEKMVSLNKKFRLPARILFDIDQDARGRYWIASNIGLFCCTPQGDSAQTIGYTTFDGLPANEIHQLAITPGKIFFSSIYGVSSLPLDDGLKETTDPKIYLNSLKINGERIDPENLPGELSHDRNSLKFSFDVLSFKNNQHHIVYCLKGRDEKFVHDNTTELVMENLSPGKYELIVYGENEKRIRSREPFVYKFYIAVPFWWTWWFISLMVVLLVVIFIFTLRRFVQRAQRRANEQNRINTILAESQLTAIQAQMNPHFVFNAINSIQNYILKNQKEEAYDYLAKFSHLVRLVLNNSQKKMLPLNKELETLGMYVELEQLRFKQAFDFELQVDPMIDEQEVLLPPMLIQPLLENAIWHGLMSLEKSKKGKLVLAFSITGKQLKITIEDNGIGREQARKNKMNLDHHSMALKLVKERIGMVKQLYQSMEEAHLHIIDLVDEAGLATGTRVEIYLPIL